MSPSKISLLAIAVASIGLAVGVSRFATAATQPIDDLASNEGIYVDKGSFKVMKSTRSARPQRVSSTPREPTDLMQRGSLSG